MQQTILHADMDAFFASVEQHDHPEWRGKPVVVGAPPDRRGVVAAASYEARRYGIRSAMPSREAYRLCPQAIFTPVNGKRYEEVSAQVFAIFERFTPLVEPVSVDEAFLDVTGSRRLFGDGVAIAGKLKTAVHAETGLTISVGVAANKFLAKLASDLNKPDGVTVVPEARDDILAFLAPLSVGKLWGVGQVTRKVLEDQGIRTIGDVQRQTAETLGRIVGRHGALHLLRLAQGEDARDLELEHTEQSLSREHTFPSDCADAAALEQKLCDLVESVGARLRAHGWRAGVAHLKLRWQGFKTITRQRALRPASCDDFALREAGLALFRAEELVRPVRLIGFGVSELGEARTEGQLMLFDEPVSQVRREALSQAVDTIRARFGEDRIVRGSHDVQPAARPRRGRGGSGPRLGALAAGLWLGASALTGAALNWDAGVAAGRVNGQLAFELGTDEEGTWSRVEWPVDGLWLGVDGRVTLPLEHALAAFAAGRAGWAPTLSGDSEDWDWRPWTGSGAVSDYSICRTDGSLKQMDLRGGVQWQPARRVDWAGWVGYEYVSLSYEDADLTGFYDYGARPTVVAGPVSDYSADFGGVCLGTDIAWQLGQRFTLTGGAALTVALSATGRGNWLNAGHTFEQEASGRGQHLWLEAAWRLTERLSLFAAAHRTALKADEAGLQRGVMAGKPYEQNSVRAMELDTTTLQAGLRAAF